MGVARQKARRWLVVALVCTTLAAGAAALVLRGRPALVYRGDWPVYDMAAADDGSRVAIGSLGMHIVDGLQFDVVASGMVDRFVVHVELSADGSAAMGRASTDEAVVYKGGRMQVEHGAPPLPNAHSAKRTAGVAGRLVRIAHAQVSERSDIEVCSTSGAAVVRRWHVDGNHVNDVAISPRGDLVAAAIGARDHPWPVDRDGRVEVLEVASGRRRVLRAHYGGVTRVQFVENGAKLLSAGMDGRVYRWTIGQ